MRLDFRGDNMESGSKLLLEGTRGTRESERVRLGQARASSTSLQTQGCWKALSHWHTLLTMATSALPLRRAVRQDFETITKIQHGKILLFYVITFLKFLKECDKPPNQTGSWWSWGKKTSPAQHQEPRPGLSGPAWFWGGYLGHRECPSTAQASKDLTGCDRPHKHFLRKGKWFGQPSAPLKALRTFPSPAGCADVLFKPQNCPQQSSYPRRLVQHHGGTAQGRAGISRPKAVQLRQHKQQQNQEECNTQMGTQLMKHGAGVHRRGGMKDSVLTKILWR